METKEFRDPIHGFVEVNQFELKIIDTPIFQRLHNIKQLSLGHLVYHSAEHSRFGHVIGTMHLAGEAFDALKENTKKLDEKFEADDVDRRTLRIAALLHDVGHTPFSHSLQNLLNVDHEEYSNALIDHYFASSIEEAGVNRELVKNLILGEPYPKKPYLSKIINGQLDVDRLDYLLRDTRTAGVWYGEFDLDRIIEQLAVVENNLVVMEGGFESIEQLIVARHHMYQSVYFHKTKRAFELMLWKCSEILKENEILKYPSIKELEEEEGRIKYANCDDNWFLNLLNRDDNPQEVKIISKMIKNRKPYLQAYSPLTYKRKSEEVLQEPEDSAPELKPIQISLLKELASLGIEEHELLTDDKSRAPYNLMPNYPISNELDPEGSSIQIYYKNNKVIEPIEKRSKLIHILGKNRPFMIRGFVIPEKYNIVRGFLKEHFDYDIPER